MVLYDVKDKLDVLRVCSAGKVWVNIGTALLVDVDEHHGYEVTRMEVVTPGTCVCVWGEGVRVGGRV